MNNKQPKDPLYPRGFDDNNEFRKQISKQENFSKPKEKNELSLLKSLNHKIGVYLSPNSTEISENEKKKKIGVIITTLILITLIMSAYYFVIYEPSQEELSFIKTSKLNELHDLYKGPLTTSVNAVNLENEIKNANSPQELENINLLIPATKDWKSFHKKSIYKNQDNYNRTMVTYENETKDMIIPINDAITIVNENDAKILSNIKFEKPNTVSVPVLISRLQAGAGLIQVGSIVDIYTNNNDTNITSNTNPDISGCTVLAIMRYEENWKIDSEYSKSNLKVNGNETNPNEKTKGFSSNVLELIKASMLNGYNEDKTIELLKNYGIKLSNYERQINLGDLDAQYMLLIETPNDKVNYMLNNMDKIVLTIPTTHAPEWMINEINS